MVHAIVLLKLKDAKSRLSSIFKEEQRQSLVLFMLAHVLNVLNGFPLTILTLSSDVPDLGLDERGNINSGIVTIRQEINDDLLIVPCDIPFLTKEDVLGLIGDGKTVAIAPSHNGGTSGLYIPKDQDFIPHFGKMSLDIHLKEAEKRNQEIRVFISDNFRDVDTKEDLDWILSCSEKSEITSFIESLGYVFKSAV
ncbi:MAG: 2-phospho-L-lactate guanylyltransferase [Candidatus Methanofastidiosia archaeon]